MAKLAVIIVSRNTERVLEQALVRERFFFTRLGSSGGFLKKKNVTLLLGLNDEQVTPLIALLKKTTPEKNKLIGAETASLSSESGLPPLPVGATPITTGGATLFVVPLEQLQRF